MDQKGALVVDLSWIVVALPSLYQGVKSGPWRFHWYSARLEVASIAVLLVSNVPAITVSAWLCDAGRAGWRSYRLSCRWRGRSRRPS